MRRLRALASALDTSRHQPARTRGGNIGQVHPLCSARRRIMGEMRVGPACRARSPAGRDFEVPAISGATGSARCATGSARCATGSASARRWAGRSASHPPMPAGFAGATGGPAAPAR